MSNVVPVNTPNTSGIVTLYTMDDGIVGAWCPSTGRGQIGDRFVSAVRTCHPVEDYSNPENDPWGDRVCSECRTSLMFDYDGSPYPYCYGCGASVIN